MNSEKESRRRIELSRVDKVVLCIVAMLVLVVIVLGILQRCGLTLINGMLMLHIPFLAVVVLVGWIGYALVRRISKRGVKVAVGGLLVLVYALALVVVFTYLSFMGSVAVPQRYATLASPSGAHKVVVMRAIDLDEDRLEARKAARLEADPNGDPETSIQDWGVVCKAYPSVMNIFYRSNADVEGEIYLTYDASRLVSQEQSTEEGEEGAAPAEPLPRGTLMVEWLDDENTVHFYVDQPGAGEGGECTVRF